jgi:hypothetical protein
MGRAAEIFQAISHVAQNLLKDYRSVMEGREGERGLSLRQQRRRTRSKEAWFSNHEFT